MRLEQRPAACGTRDLDRLKRTELPLCARLMTRDRAIWRGDGDIVRMDRRRSPGLRLASAGPIGRSFLGVRCWAIAMTGTKASTSPPALPRWFGPRASADDPAVSALIDRVARGAVWADIGGELNLNVRIDAEPSLVLRVHRPWPRRGRVAGLRRLRERLQRTQVRVARPIRMSGRDLVRVADRWAEIEEFIDHVQPPANEDSSVRLLEELGRFHTALRAVWEPSPPEPLDDHRTLGQLRYSVGFTRRRLGPRSEPVVHRMRQLTAELSKLRQEVELPCGPIHGDYKLGNVGELPDGSWATFDLDFARVRERLYDIAGSMNHIAQSGALLEPRRLLDAYESTAPEPLTPDEHRWLPGALALVPLHWAATAGLVGDSIHKAESAMTAAEAWWSRRAELSS
jgi:Ser/Thr protein kinase RdoA (MazF antagonist)